MRDTGLVLACDNVSQLTSDRLDGQSTVVMLRVAALLALLVSVGACAPPSPAPVKTFGPAEIARGKVFYDTNGCVACHGATGRGDGQLASTLTPLPRDFRHADAFKGPRTIASVAAAIAQGIPAVPTPMPAFAHLDLETRQLIAAYVLSLGE